MSASRRRVSRRRSLRVVVRIAVMSAALLAATTAGTAAGEPARPLRAVTFNMLHGGPASGLRADGSALEDRLELTATQLRALAPDVIALQEASVSRGRGNVAARLAATLGMHHVHALATTRVLPIGFLNQIIVTLMNFAEGPAVLSRYPITAHEVYDLPRCEQRLHARVLLRAEVAAPGGPVAVFSTHLTRDDCQVTRVAEIVGERAARGPAVLMGDFNTGETAAAVTRLRDGGAFVDAYRAANPAEPGHTVWQRPGAPDRTVMRRVDYIFVAGVDARSTVSCGSRVVLDTPLRDGERTLWPSDHYGVLADLDLFGIKCAP